MVFSAGNFKVFYFRIEIFQNFDIFNEVDFLAKKDIWNSNYKLEIEISIEVAPSSMPKHNSSNSIDAKCTPHTCLLNFHLRIESLFEFISW